MNSRKKIQGKERENNNQTTRQIHKTEKYKHQIEICHQKSNIVKKMDLYQDTLHDISDHWGQQKDFKSFKKRNHSSHKDKKLEWYWLSQH